MEAAQKMIDLLAGLSNKVLEEKIRKEDKTTLEDLIKIQKTFVKTKYDKTNIIAIKENAEKIIETYYSFFIKTRMEKLKMTYMISAETWDTCLTFMAILFAACIACEWLKDDMKLLYQGVILLINAAMGLIMGWLLFTENVLYYSYGAMEYSPLGFVVASFGAFCAILLLVVWLPKILKPYAHAGSIYGSPSKTLPDRPVLPKTPREPGGF